MQEKTNERHRAPFSNKAISPTSKFQLLLRRTFPGILILVMSTLSTHVCEDNRAQGIVCALTRCFPLNLTSHLWHVMHVCMCMPPTLHVTNINAL